MKRNQFFNIFKTISNKEPEELISTIRIRYEDSIWEKICQLYLDNAWYVEMSHNDPYGAIYHLNIKDYLKWSFQDVYEEIKSKILKDFNINIDEDEFIICLATSYDYRKIDEQFDNEMSFIDYINSELSECDKHRYITEDILKYAGFEYLENESNLGNQANKLNPELCWKDYKVFRKWTDDKPYPIKLDIDNGQNNRGTNWHLHIDNNSCETIGCADIDTVWEFNTLMQVFKSKLRL